MNPVVNRNGTLFVENLRLSDIADRFGTPCYVYSHAALTAAFEEFRSALCERPALICYSVKANSNLAILNLFARLGAGFDIVSGGELARVLAAGGDPGKTMFSGVGKSREEMAQALAAGIHCFNVESSSELRMLEQVAAAHGMCAPVSIRVNPDVDAKTHPYISTGLRSNKFGIAIEDAPALYRQAAELAHIRILGIDCHIGSQIQDPAPLAEAAEKLVGLADRLAVDGIAIEHLDLGGGMGIRYRAEETMPDARHFLAPMLKVLAGRPEKLVFEPGRSLVGNAGLLLTRIRVIKHGPVKSFAIVDAAMNDLTRPALYDAWHDIVPVTQRNEAAHCYDIVGPICESSDVLGRDRELAVVEDDLLAILSAGAYGMSMSSNYNSRPRPAEILIDGDRAHTIRHRESIEDLFAAESVLPA